MHSIFITLSLALPCLYFQIGGANPFIIKNNLTLPLLVMTIAAGIRQGSIFNKCTPPRYLMVLVLLLSISSVASLLTIQAPFRGIEVLVYQTIYMLWLLAVNSHNDPEGFQHHYDRTVFILGCLVALYGIKQALLPGWLNPGYLSQGKMSVYSSIGNANYLAFFLFYSGTLTFGLYTKTTNPVLRKLLVLGLLLQAGCFLLTFSRTTYVAAAIITTFIVYTHARRRHSDRFLLQAALVLLIIAGTFIIAASNHWISPRLLDLHTLHGRLIIWRAAYKMIVDHPLLGVGLGQFEVNYIPYQEFLFRNYGLKDYFANASLALTAHCEPLNIWAETGFLGCLSFILLAAAMVWNGLRIDIQDDRRWHFYGCVGLLWVGLYNNFLHVGPLALLFWTSLGLVIKQTKDTRWLWVELARGLLMIGFICLAALLTIRLYTVGLSNRYERLSDEMCERGHYKEAVYYAERAVFYNPINGYAREKYALSLYLSGKLVSAYGQLDTAALYSGDIGIPYLKAEILAQQGENDRAIAIYNYIANAFPTHITPHLMLGQLYLRQKKWRLARFEFQRVLEIQPSRHNLKMDWRKIKAQRDIARFFLKCGP